MVVRFRSILIAFFLSFGSLTGIAQDSTVTMARMQYREAVRDYGKKDFTGALAHLKNAVQLMPSHPRYVYGLAGMHAMVGAKKEALHHLEQLAAWGLDYRPENDSDFVSLFDDPEFRTITKRMSSNREEIGSARPIAELPPGITLTEGIAYDPIQKTVYVGGVSSRSIIRRSEDGSVSDFSVPEDSLLGVFGMRVDERRRLLWVCSSAVPQMKNYRESDKGLAMVARYDLTTGRLTRKYLTSDVGSSHLFGDLTVHPNGDVYISDSQTSAIYRIASQSGELDLFLKSGQFSSLQGIDISEDGKTMYAADYAKGLFSIDLKSKVCREIKINTTTTLGIDGLYVRGNSLVAIQNGISPQRIVRIIFDEQGEASAEVLEANNPLFDEPTLGVIAGDWFLFVANSQWASIKEGGEVVPGRTLRPHVLMERKL